MARSSLNMTQRQQLEALELDLRSGACDLKVAAEVSRQIRHENAQPYPVKPRRTPGDAPRKYRDVTARVWPHVKTTWHSLPKVFGLSDEQTRRVYRHLVLLGIVERRERPSEYRRVPPRS